MTWHNGWGFGGWVPMSATARAAGTPRRAGAAILTLLAGSAVALATAITRDVPGDQLADRHTGLMSHELLVLPCRTSVVRCWRGCRFVRDTWRWVAPLDEATSEPVAGCVRERSAPSAGTDPGYGNEYGCPCLTPHAERGRQ